MAQKPTWSFKAKQKPTHKPNKQSRSLKNPRSPKKLERKKEGTKRKTRAIKKKHFGLKDKHNPSKEKKLAKIIIS